MFILSTLEFGLGPKSANVILSKIERMKETGTAIVEQKAKKALSVSARGYVLVNGTCVMEGDAASLFAQDSSEQRYLGLAKNQEPRDEGQNNNSTFPPEKRGR